MIFPFVHHRRRHGISNGILGRVQVGRFLILADVQVGVHKSVIVRSTAGVVASCKIPILATRVRFPGSAILCDFYNQSFFFLFWGGGGLFLCVNGASV